MDRRKGADGKRGMKDKGINKKGEELIKWMEEEGWGIMNGVKEEEEEGEITFTGGEKRDSHRLRDRR